jgi:hypothetical protein
MRGNLAMDHEMVVREKMTEKYLLHELDPDLRDRFEEHFFACPDCALDIRAGSELVAQSKIVLAETSLAETPETIPVHLMPSHPHQVGRGWLAWLRPAFVLPVILLLLAVIGYQNLVLYPQLQSSLHNPRVLPWASINVGTWGGNSPTIAVPRGKGFLLFVRIPPNGTYARYTANLYDPSGKLEWSLTIPATSEQDQWPVQIPAANRASGSYTLDVRGVSAIGESQEIGKASFELQVQK